MRSFDIWTDGKGRLVAVLPSDTDESNPIYAITHDPKNVLLNRTSDLTRVLDAVSTEVAS